MSNAAIPNAAAAGPAASAKRPTQSLGARVTRYVLGRWGARLGVGWVAMLLAAAVLAPWLASSHPLLWKLKDDAAPGWSSPLLAHLTAADVILLVLGLTALVLWPIRRMGFGLKAGVVVWMFAAVTPLAIWPSVVDDWSQWTERLPVAVFAGMLGVLGVADAMLLIAIPLRLRLRVRGLATLLGAAGVLAAILTLFPVRPPEAVVFSKYREAIAAGQVEKAIFAPVPYSPSDRLRDRGDMRQLPPDADHWMGTTVNGEDLLSRMLHASRIALSVGFIATGLAVVLGVIIGGLMGYFSGTVDLLGMRLVEVFSAIPRMFLLIAFVAFWGRNIYLIMAIIGLTSWNGYALFVRAEFFKLRQQDFVQAARACGLPLWSILFKHMLPNGVTPVLVNASFGVAAAILAESTLSFLGLGLVEEPSWGQMLNQARSASGAFQWWLAMFPGLAIFLTVFAYNLVGEALRDALDPHTARLDAAREQG